MLNYPFIPSLQEDTKPKPVEPTDAAGLIAEALKRKFAHRYQSDSECDSNFNLPAPENKTHVETPLVREITRKNNLTSFVLVPSSLCAISFAVWTAYVKVNWKEETVLGWSYSSEQLM